MPTEFDHVAMLRLLLDGYNDNNDPFTLRRLALDAAIAALQAQQPGAMNNVARGKIAKLEARGYRVNGVGIVNDAGHRGIVSSFGRVDWIPAQQPGARRYTTDSLDADARPATGEPPMTATERPSELKACPFCGQSGNAKVWDGHDPITGVNRGVFCVCGASMRYGEDSAAAWNRRTLDVAPSNPAPTDSVAIGSKSVEPRSEHWRRAITLFDPDYTDEQWAEIEQYARELARENDNG